MYNNNDLTLELTAYVDETQYMIQGYRTAEILGYANTRQAILAHVNDEEKISRSLIVGWRAKTNENKKIVYTSYHIHQ